MIINGDGGYGLLAADIDGPEAQAGWLGPRSAATWRRSVFNVWTLAMAIDDSTIVVVNIIIIIVVIIINVVVAD